MNTENRTIEKYECWGYTIIMAISKIYRALFPIPNQPSKNHLDTLVLLPKPYKGPTNC